MRDGEFLQTLANFLIQVIIVEGHTTTTHRVTVTHLYYQKLTNNRVTPEMLMEEKSLDQWKFYIVQKEEGMKAGTFHHHIIDASSTGEVVWRHMMAATTRHLLGEKAK